MRGEGETGRGFGDELIWGFFGLFSVSSTTLAPMSAHDVHKTRGDDITSVLFLRERGAVVREEVHLLTLSSSWNGGGDR